VILEVECLFPARLSPTNAAMAKPPTRILPSPHGQETVPDSSAQLPGELVE
jgi:hypothetical protein